MDKNTVIGFCLIALVLVGFSWWSKPSKEEMAEAARQDSIARAQIADEALRAPAPAPTVAEVDSNSIFWANAAGEGQDIVLDNGKVAVTISTLGGTPTRAVIAGYKDQKGDDVQLLDGELALALAAKAENIRLSDLRLDVEQLTETTATLSATAANGGKLTLEYALRPDAYMLDLTVAAQGLGGYFAPSMRSLDICWTQRAHQQEKGFTFENRYSTLTYKVKDGGTKKLSEQGDSDKKPEKTLDWVAFKNQFFSAILIAHDDINGAALASKQCDKGSGCLKEYSAVMQTAFDPSGGKPTTMQMYLGPNNFNVLKASNKLSASDKKLALDDLVYFGWPLFRWINRWLIMPLFSWLSSMGLQMGVVLLLLTLIVKALVYPATRKSYLSSARMRVLKPEVDKLAAKYPKKEDAMKKQQEMMQLYSQYGVSPMGGCLPMLVQMPIWIALFNFVPNAIELRGQSFLWATDLSAYDDLIRWDKELWLIGDHISLFCVLFAVTNILNTIISMKQQQTAAMSHEQEQQMKMMRWMMYVMPVMFFFIFNDYSSGLCYYYFLSGLISVLMMWALRRFTDDEKLLAQLRAYKTRHAADPKKPGGLAQRLAAMQQLAEEQRKQQTKKP